MPKIGDAVQYRDVHGSWHNALVTMVWDGGKPEEFPTPAINVLWVVDDISKTDNYGRQIDRSTSVPYQKDQTAPGFSWRFVTDDVSV